MSTTIQINPRNTEQPSLDKRIYKVKQLVNGSINSIYVFNGKTKPGNEEELFKTIFTDKEIEQIKSEKISVKFSEEYIHFDDSIGTIKAKIFIELKKNISLDEIYLYCQKLETLNSISVYQSLTQNNKLELTKLRLDQFMSNIVTDESGEKFKKPEEKEVYSFDDIFEMKFDNKNYIVNKVLGQKFFIVENEYPFICNPYEVEEYDKFFEKSARKSLTTLNSHLLLNNGDIIDNSIYLCLAEDVLNYIQTKDISEETTVKIYFPFLYNKNINGLEDIHENRDKLVQSNKKFITEKTSETFNTINMFYDVYYSRKTDLKYVNKGIKYIKAIVAPEFDVKIPLEIIFKIVHATQDCPLIKYNPSTRQENVYRLYADKISDDGRKIPYLKKANVFKLMKNIARSKSVAVYIETTSNGSEQSLICEFDENGYITIYSEFKTVISVDKIDDIFRGLINPIIDEIAGVLEQSGYKLNKFHSLKDNNVEIKQMTYETQIEIKKPLDIEEYKGCISSIYINETNAFKGKTINLRFKRVSNYSKFTSQEAFVLEKSGQGLRGDEIIESLLVNFPEDLDRNQAVELVRKVANELEVERGVRKSDIKIKNNPGFKTIISLEKETGIITVTTENINNINYLYTIPIYLDTMVRLTQEKKGINYDAKKLKKLCSTDNKVDFIVDDIISPVEESVSKSEEPSIENGEDVEYTKFRTVELHKPKGALSLFFDDDDEYDENDSELEGGDKDSDSEESIESEPSVESEESVKSESEKSLPSMPSLSSSEESVKEDVKIVEPEKESSVESESEKSLPSMPSLSSSEVSVKEDVKMVEPEPEQEPEKKLSPIPCIPVKNNKDKKERDKPKKQKKEVEKKPVIKEPVEEPDSEEEAPVEEPDSEEESEAEAEAPLEEPVKEPVEEPVEAPLEEPVKEPDLEEEAEEEPVAEPEAEAEEAEEDPVEAPVEEPAEESDSEEEVEENIRDIDGMKLNKPYYFETLIEKRDPVLILKEDTPKFNSYSRTCSSSTRRQPVILTDAQLDKIKKEHKGFLRDEDVIKYGSDENHQNNYICPRYWCLKNNTIVNPNDLKEVIGKDGKKELVHPTCGKVLPKGENKVKPGYYIYEFYEPKQGKNDYKKYPGLIPDSHPDGLCLPCCFDKYNTEGRIAANKKCYEKDEKKEQPKEEKKEKDVTEYLNDDYIKGPHNFPLDKGRWGYLPPEIEIMLKEFNAGCQISKTNTNLKENHPCLLRHGIEVNNKQSFIACISDVLYFSKQIRDENGKITNKYAKVLNVKEMRDRIIRSLNVDTFITFQNGNLVTDFTDMNKTVDIRKYSNAKIFSKLDMNKQSDKAYFTKVISAFENFIQYLQDDDAIIDHTYLWDIVSMPNKFLFPEGVNLVIFNLPKDDITNNVQMLCPTNHYSSEFYQARKPTIIILKETEYYEPIYSYTKNKKGFPLIVKEYKEKNPHLSLSMKTVFKEIIKPFFNLVCQPLDSMPNVYKVKKPLRLYELIQKLDKYEYTIKKFVLNFNNKVIGVIAEEPPPYDRNGFIPCYPSAINEELKKDITLVFMNDLSLWTTYKDTVQFLNKLHKHSKKRKLEADIPYVPAFKIIEEDHVVGILTNTNQFIQLSQPIRVDEIESNSDLPNLPSIDNDNYIINSTKPKKDNYMIQSEVAITTSQDIDKERVDYIKKIKLESSFYNVFRNTIRVLINNYENSKIRGKIENELLKEYIIYSEKLKNIDRLLRELVKNKIQFIGDDNY